MSPERYLSGTICADATLAVTRAKAPSAKERELDVRILDIKTGPSHCAQEAWSGIAAKMIWDVAVGDSDFRVAQHFRE